MRKEESHEIAKLERERNRELYIKMAHQNPPKIEYLY
jgi:hypothetical protein